MSADQSPRAGDGKLLTLPQFMRAEVERAIAVAKNPPGMSLHDGKAVIGHDKLVYMLALIDSQAAALAAAPAAAPAWQPIETAPKDMASRLYLCNGVTVEGFRDATGAMCVRQEGETSWRRMRWEPSHWMPLSAAPSFQAPATVAAAEGSQP